MTASDNLLESPASNDFRSDTVTTPIPEMVAAIHTSSWGDSVFGEDRNVLDLEAKVADLTGKEAALFCVSGTLSNQLGVRVNLEVPPHSVLCDHRAHIYTAEAGGLATLSQAMVTPVIPSNGVYLTLEDIKPHIIWGSDIHTAPTKLISLENTLTGTIMPIEEIKRISEYARANGLRMHLDGARLWNASAETGVSLREYCQYFDTVSLCLSKGLCTPVGSVLVGEKTAITRATWFRKQQGGGIRQAGWLAAAGSIAIDKVWPTMKTTHARARALASRLADMDIHTKLPVQTGFVVVDFERAGIHTEVFQEVAKENDLKVWGNRLALHYYTSDAAIERMILTLKESAIRSKTRARTEDSFKTRYGGGSK